MVSMKLACDCSSLLISRDDNLPPRTRIDQLIVPAMRFVKKQISSIALHLRRLPIHILTFCSLMERHSESI